MIAAIHDRVMDEVMLGADRVALAGGSPPEQLAMLSMTCRPDVRWQV